MRINKLKENLNFNLIIQFCGLFSFLLGFLAILGWTFDITQFASFDYNKIPMALSSAVLFVIFGFILFFHARFPSNRIVNSFSIGFIYMGFLSSLLLLYLSLKGIRLDYEHLSFQLHSVVNGLVVGHMSPVTAYGFVFVSLSALILLTKSLQKKFLKISLILSILIFIISLIFLLSYLFDAPLLYGGSYIPPALTTSLAFLSLGIALALMSGFNIWSYKELLDAFQTRYTNILILIFSVIIIGLIIGGYFYYKSYETQFRSELDNQLALISKLKVNEIVAWRKERLEDASIFYRNLNFSLLVERYISNRNDYQSLNNIRIWMDHVRTAYLYDRLSLYDLNGIDLLNSTNNIRTHSHSFNKNLLETIQSGKINFVDFYSNRKINRVYLNIFIPVFDSGSSNKVIGILTMRIDPEYYLYPLINNWPTPDKTAEFILIRQEGNSALCLNQLRFKKNTALNFLFPSSQLSLAAIQAIGGKTGIMDAVDYRQEPVVAYIRPIPDSPWFIIAKMDVSEIYAPLRERFWGIIILFVGLLIAAGASMGLVWWRQRANYNKERFRIERTLRNSQAQLNALVQTIPDLIWLKDIDGVYLSCNKMFERFFGANETEIIGKTDYDFVDREQADLFRDNDRKAITNGHPTTNEETVNFADDGHLAILDVIKTPMFDKTGRLIGVLGIGHDITKRKQKEELRLKLKKAVDNSGEIIFLVDKNGVFTYANPAFTINYGYSQEEIIGKSTPRILKSGLRSTNDYKLFWENMQLGNDVREEIVNKKKDGNIINVESSSSAIFDEKKNIIGFIGIQRDITERKLHEKELIQSKEKAESANKLKNAFIANISHEIRTPLNGILGMAGLIRELFENEIKPEDEELFEGIDLSGQRLIRTVDMILNYSRLQVGEFPFSRKIFEASAFCNNISAKYIAAAESKSLDLLFNNNCGIANIFADEYSITMAVSNLLDNAIKYTNKGYIHITLYKNKENETLIDIKDTGIGIDPDYLLILFEPYSQEQSGYGRAYDGVGLGLSIVKQILAQQNVNVSVKSKKGVGTTFSINFGKEILPV